MLIQFLSAAQVRDIDGNPSDLKKMLQHVQKKCKNPLYLEVRAHIPLAHWPAYQACGFACGVSEQEQITVYAWPGLRQHWQKTGTLALPMFEPVPVQRVTLPTCQQAIQVLRLDVLHPLLMGNKWFKLQHNLQAMADRGLRELLTFGGAYSNHVYATAAAGQLLGIPTRAIIRGEPVQNPVLDAARANGLQCAFWSRSDYRQKDHAYAELRARYPEAWLVPEGGHNPEGIQGTEGIWQHIPALQKLASGPWTVLTACGTGSTLAGLIRACPHPELALHGVAVLKGGDFLTRDVQAALSGGPGGPLPTWQVHTAFHGGGYARCNAELKAFLAAFARCNPQVPVEPVYTGKLFWAIEQLLLQQQLQPPILALHTGGVYAAPQDHDMLRSNA